MIRRSAALSLRFSRLTLPVLSALLALNLTALMALMPQTARAAQGAASGLAQESPAIVSADAWGSTPSSKMAAPHKIAQLTVHHQGEFWTHGADVPAYLRRLQQWSRAAKGWVDVPYHYIIGPDGTIYAGRSPAIAGDTNTEYDTQGHLQVMLLGNFEEQTVTPRQWDSTVQLLAHLLKAHGLGATRIGAHRHHATQTVCPGAGLMARFEELRQAASHAVGR
ncbi:MAG: peptidoglycan recognition family protein [Betaproteobacteria bacterium]|jgi:Ni/Co efflux regulator RcnB